MWRKLLRILGFLIGCGVVCAYILYASHLAQEHRAEQVVTDVIISMTDSTEMRQFASSSQIAEQLKRGGFKIEGVQVNSLDAIKIENYIDRNGFVSDADVYVTYSGTAHIDIKQHEPVMRFMSGGFNSYITREGDVFRSPRGAAYYTAVVTGGYKPQFVPEESGDIASRYAVLKGREDERLAKLATDYARLNEECKEYSKRKAEHSKDKKRKMFESKKSQKQREVSLNMEIAKCDDQIKQLKGRMARVEQQRQSVEMRKKKLQKKYEDFCNLINFVGRISDDSFWGAEVVQIVADTTSTGEITLHLVPRSGDFVIVFGTLAESEKKINKLQEFYDNGLSHFGWDRYKSVDVRYDKQVICTE